MESKKRSIDEILTPEKSTAVSGSSTSTENDRKLSKAAEDTGESRPATPVPSLGLGTTGFQAFATINPFQAAASGTSSFLSFSNASNPFSSGVNNPFSAFSSTTIASNPFTSSIGSNPFSQSSNSTSNPNPFSLLNTEKAASSDAFSRGNTPTPQSILKKSKSKSDNNDDNDNDAGATNDNEDGDDVDIEAEQTGGTYGKIYQLPEVPVVTGEENEVCVYQLRVKLYRLVQRDSSVPTRDSALTPQPDADSSTTSAGAASGQAASSSLEWAEVGLGPVKLLRSTASDGKTTTYRLVMRRESKPGGPGTKVLLNVGLRRYVVFSRVGDRAVQLVCLAPRPVTDATTTTTTATDGTIGGTGCASTASGQDFVLSTFLFKSKEAGSLASHLEDILDEVRRLEPVPSKGSSSNQDDAQQPESSTSKSGGESGDDSVSTESNADVGDRGSSKNQSDGASDKPAA